MAGDALARLVVLQVPSRMIVQQDMPIGWPDGVLARKLGVARMRAKDALLQLVDVHEHLILDVADR